MAHSKGVKKSFQTYLDQDMADVLTSIGKEIFQDVTNWQAPLLRKIIREWLEDYKRKNPDKPLQSNRVIVVEDDEPAPRGSAREAEKKSKHHAHKH